MKGRVIDLGRMEYKLAWAQQKEAEASVISGGEDTLFFVEHDPVLTLSPGYHQENLLLSMPDYATRGIALERTDRGGDITYHGPGQLTIYPVFDVSRHGRDLHRWLRDLEETMLLVLRELNIEGRRFPPHTGVWIGDQKVAAIGVKIRKWVSTHGIALNCLDTLDGFDTIVPCGIQGYGVTSLSVALGRGVGLNEAKPLVVRAFQEVFELDFD